jgi:hypothetical protein
MSDNRIADRPLPAAPPPNPVESPRSKKSGAGWIVATALFVAIVAGVAWISQYIPRGVTSGGPKPPTRPAPVQIPDLDFVVMGAMWEKPTPGQVEERPHAKEFEHGVEGHYDFPFRNKHEYPMTIGFWQTSCDCSSLKGAALSPDEVAGLPTDASKMPVPDLPGRTWTDLPKDQHTGVEIPANGGGIVRMSWNSRKRAGEYLKLNITVWMAPSDRLDEKVFANLHAPILITTPIRFEPARLSLGTLSTGGVAEGAVFIHSATRTTLPLVVDKAQLDDLFDVRLEPLDAAALKTLENQLRAQKFDTRLTAATKAVVTLREQQGGKQLDQGLFSRTLPVHLEGESDIAPPLVTAITRGDVEIGTGDDIGRIVFRPFPTREGNSRKIPLWTENPADLIVEGTSPSFIGAKLTRDKKDTGTVRKKWNLEVTLPPGALVGTLPEDAVIILRTDTQPPRRIRIPVVATGGQG